MKKLFVGNWKMYLSDDQAEKLAKEYVEAANCSEWEVVGVPSFTALEEVSSIFEGSKVGLGGQDGFWEDEGAFTGEVSMKTLKEIGAEYVIVGHSEQRKYFDLTDEMVAKKVLSGLSHDLKMIVCVGETGEEKKNGKREEVITREVVSAIADVRSEDTGKLLIAYEPRWAIGTGEPSTPEYAIETHLLIKKILMEKFGDASNNIRILYGGSVNSKNYEQFISKDVVDGILVGGASTKPDELKGILCG